jgi:hypothetical protein
MVLILGFILLMNILSLSRETLEATFNLPSYEQTDTKQDPKKEDDKKRVSVLLDYLINMLEFGFTLGLNAWQLSIWATLFWESHTEYISKQF